MLLTLTCSNNGHKRDVSYKCLCMFSGDTINLSNKLKDMVTI
jgi:hypothetical protein